MFVVLTIVGSIISVVLGLFDRSGDSVLVVARVWSRGVLGSAGVKLRVRSLLAKLGDADRAQAALVALERGFVRIQ